MMNMQCVHLELEAPQHSSVKLAISICSPLASAVAPAVLHPISGHGHKAASASSARGVVSGQLICLDYLTCIREYTETQPRMRGLTTHRDNSVLKHICCQVTTDLSFMAQHRSDHTCSQVIFDSGYMLGTTTHTTSGFRNVSYTCIAEEPSLHATTTAILLLLHLQRSTTRRP
jgi:hypothetical protein